MFLFEKNLEKEFLKDSRNSNNYKVTVFFHDIFNYKFFNKIKNKNLIFIPNYKIHKRKQMVWWFRYRKIKFATLDRECLEFLLRYNFDIFHLNNLKNSDEISDDDKIKFEKAYEKLWELNMKKFTSFAFKRLSQLQKTSARANYI